MATPKKTPPPEPAGEDTVEPETPELTTAEIAHAASRLRGDRVGPDEIHTLQQLYRDVAIQDDEDARALTRSIISKLRRVRHEDLHPHCGTVTVQVPLLPQGCPVTINGKAYQGAVTVYECVAQQLAYLVSLAREIDAERLRDGGRSVSLDEHPLRAISDRVQAAG